MRTMGHRLKGMYEQLKNEQVTMCRGILVTKLMTMGKEARAQGISCGVVVNVGRGGGGLYIKQVPNGLD